MKQKRRTETFTDEVNQKIIKLLNDGYSQIEISKILNVDFKLLRNYMEDWGGVKYFTPNYKLKDKTDVELLNKIKNGRTQRDIDIIDRMVERGEYKLKNRVRRNWDEKDEELCKLAKTLSPPLPNSVIAMLLKIKPFNLYRQRKLIRKNRTFEENKQLDLFREKNEEEMEVEPSNEIEVKPYSYTEMQGEIEALKMHINILYDLLQNKGNNDVRSVTNTRN